MTLWGVDRSGRSRWRRPAALGVLTLALGVGLRYLLRSQGLANTANWTQLILFVVAILQLTPSVLRTAVAMSDSPEHVAKAREALAALVLAQWRGEIIVRQLDNPEPAIVRWKLTDLRVMDFAGRVFGSGSSGGGGRRDARRAQRPAARLQVTTDRIDELAREFRALRRRRLVILGDPGMGKTTLAVLLLRHLLEHPEPGDAVPVLIQLSSWDPESEDFRDWLTRRLGEEYHALRAPAFGGVGHQILVAAHQILPVLDGLDELPGPRRITIIAALNAGMTESDPLILTCRTDEFQQAVTAPGGEILRGAAVIEPLPLDAAGIATYLGHLLGPDPQGTWPDLLAGIRAGRSAPLADALTTPLNLWLMRKVYIDQHRDPGPLNDTAQFAGPQAVVDHLLDHLVPAVMTPGRNQPGRNQPGRNQPGQHQSGPQWEPEDARRWLGYLAHHLDTLHTRDIAWWELYKGLSPRPVNLTAGLILGLAGGLVNGAICGLAVSGAWRWQHLATAFAVGLTGALVTGLAFAVTAGVLTTPDTLPAYADLRLRGRLSPLARQVRLGLMIGLPAGLLLALLLTPLLGANTGLLVGLTIGISTGMAGALADWAKVPLSDDRPQSPRDTLRRDQQLTYVRILSAMLTLAPAGGLAGGLALRATAGHANGLIDAAIVGLILGPVLGAAGRLKFTAKGAPAPGTAPGPRLFGGRAGLTRGRLEASVIYAVSVFGLSRRGRLPTRLMRFLEDAHQLGLLRQVGNVYQFLHADLQDRLAQTYQP